MGSASRLSDHTIRTLYSKGIGPRPPDLKPLVGGAPRLVLGPIFDLDEFICIDNSKDSAEVSSEDYSFHYQMDASLLKPRSVPSTFTHTIALCCDGNAANMFQDIVLLRVIGKFAYSIIFATALWIS